MLPNARPYDALLLVSFGGPEKREDVLPFLERVTRGRGVPLRHGGPDPRHHAPTLPADRERTRSLSRTRFWRQAGHGDGQVAAWLDCCNAKLPLGMRP